MAELTELQKQLFELQDIKYRDFHSKLMPETAKEKIIGIRTPVLRNFAKVFAGTPELEDFLQQLPHQFYEENNLHMMLITGIKDYPKCMEEVQRFLPYIDNWATCDFPEPKCFRKNKKAVLEEVRKWIASTETYIRSWWLPQISGSSSASSPGNHARYCHKRFSSSGRLPDHCLPFSQGFRLEALLRSCPLGTWTSLRLSEIFRRLVRMR